jgi:apolipoprotein N-acyltransferase
MARMRAREAGRPMLRAANTGPSAVIDADGRIVSVSAQFQSLVLRSTVTPMRGRTLFVSWGNVPVILLAVSLVTISALQYRSRRRRSALADVAPSSE